MPPGMKKIKVTQVREGHDVEVEMEVPDIPAAWPPPAERRALGKPTPRIEGMDKVTGKAVYTDDVLPPGMLYGKILRCPHPHARLVSLDLSRARAMPGVRAAISIAEVGAELNYAGQEVAAVAATSEHLAEEALRAIEAKYEILPFEVDVEKARAASGATPPEWRTQGDVEAAFRQPDVVVVEATYHAPVVVHVCMETHGMVAHWEGPDRLKAWVSTQAIHSVRSALAKAFDLKESQVEVICEHMGGGFGSKFGPGAEGLAAARLAKEAGAPVKIMLERQEEFISQGSRPSPTVTVKAAANREGKLVAWQSEGYGTGGVGSAGSFQNLPYIYACENTRTRYMGVRTNAAASCAMRAPDHPGLCFITESVMDELAYALGMDPLEFRKKNDPNEVRQREYDIGAQRIGWAQRNPKPNASPGPKKRGLGVASSIWTGGGSPGTIGHVTLHRDGSVEVAVGVQDIGTGTRTAIAIVAAQELGLNAHDIDVRIGHTSIGPGIASGGSITIASVTPAVYTACMNAKMQLFSLVAPALRCNVEDLECNAGLVCVKGDRSRSLTWKQACAKLPEGGIKVQGEWNADLARPGLAGCQFAEVEVDVETGQVKVVRIVAVHDCAIVVNPLTARSQIHGGIAMGIGYALSEERIWDVPHGLILNARLEDYKVPGTMEVPVVEAILLDRPEVTWVSGLGEPPAIPTAAAIANAVYHATGIRIRSLPITRAKILEGARA